MKIQRELEAVEGSREDRLKKDDLQLLVNEEQESEL